MLERLTMDFGVWGVSNNRSCCSPELMGDDSSLHSGWTFRGCLEGGEINMFSLSDVSKDRRIPFFCLSSVLHGVASCKSHSIPLVSFNGVQTGLSSELNWNSKFPPNPHAVLVKRGLCPLSSAGVMHLSSSSSSSNSFFFSDKSFSEQLKESS
jgi:hypothetical protein